MKLKNIILTSLFATSSIYSQSIHELNTSNKGLFDIQFGNYKNIKDAYERINFVKLYIEKDYKGLMDLKEDSLGNYIPFLNINSFEPLAKKVYNSWKPDTNYNIVDDIIVGENDDRRNNYVSIEVTGGTNSLIKDYCVYNNIKEFKKIQKDLFKQYGRLRDGQVIQIDKQYIKPELLEKNIIEENKKE